MVKIAIDAGHGIHTPGKRNRDDEREFFFNNQVASACIAKLKTYEGVEVRLLSDPTGKSDTPLAVRTNQANHWKADALVSIHHNGLSSEVWGEHGGIETYVQQKTASQASKDLAAKIHPRIVQAMGLRDRGIKTDNFHMTRESEMPAVLTEGGFFDSLTDIHALRDEAKMKAQGEAIAEGLADHFNLRPKGSVQYRVLTGTFKTKAAADKAAADIKKQFGWVVYVREE